MCKKICLLYLLLLMGITHLRAEIVNGNVTGFVLDQRKVGLIGAVVYIPQLKKAAVTDVNGKYQLVDVKPGKYTLTVSYVGCEKIEESLMVKGGVNEKNFTMNDNLFLDEVVVTGTAGETLKALNQQRNSAQIMNVISANQIGSFPDPNIGDALKRVSGVYVQYDQGEAKLVSLRGTDPSNSTISINGSAMPSTGDNRAVRIDAIPADMVQAIEVSKSITPDMDGDAIGGAINLLTRKAPHQRMLTVNAGGGYSLLTQGGLYNGGLFFGDRFFHDKLGVIASVSIYKQSLGSNEHSSSWEMGQVEDKQYYMPKYFEVEQTLMDRLRQSYTMELDYAINTNHTLTFTGIFNDYKDWRKRYNMRIDDIGNDYKVNWKKKTGYENVEIVDDAEGFVPGSNRVLDVNNDGMDDLSGATYVDYDPLHPTFYPELERHVLAGANSNGGELTHTRIFNAALGGNHLFGKLKTKWNFAYIRTSEDQPGMRDFELQSNGAADGSEELSNMVTMDYTNPRWINASSGFGIDNVLSSISGKNSEEAFRVDNWELDGFKGKDVESTADQYNAFINFELPLVEGRFQNVIKFGAKMKMMSKDKQILNRVKWHPAQDPTFDTDQKNWKWMWTQFGENMRDVSADFHSCRYSVGNSVDAKWVASQNVDPNKATSDWQVVTVYNNEMCDGYSATENVYAGYLMTTQHLGEKLQMITGVRMEHTNIEYTGTEFLERIETLQTVQTKTNYTSWLPGLHFRYNPNKDMIFRLSYAKTISRPSYRDLVPYEKINVKKKEYKLGNPDLKPTFAHNFDLLGEYYLGNIGLLSVGAYYKNIRDFRTLAVYNTPWDEIKTHIPHPDNVPNSPNIASYTKEYKAAQGKDFLTQRPINAGNANLFGLELGFQQKLQFLPGFLKNFSIYANYTHNWLENKDEQAQLSGTAEDILNASLAYETKCINLRLSYNYTSSFLTSTGLTPEQNVYCDAVNYLDANMDIYITPRIIFSLSANNLLDEVQRYYQWKKEYTYSNLSNGRRFQASVKFNIY